MFSYIPAEMSKPDSDVTLQWMADANVVICDDSITNVMILSKLIQDMGIQKTRFFTDPRKALAHVAEHRGSVDLLVLDLEMPHMSGFEVMQAIADGWQGKIPLAMETFPILVITGLQDKLIRYKALENGAADFLNKPIDPAEVVLRVRNLLRVQHAYRLQATLAQRMEIEVEQRTRELNDAVDTLVERLALAGEMRDNETGLHVVRVGRYSRIIAEGLGLPPELCYLIEKAAPLHDVGKIGIPDSILHKNDKLDADERLVMDRHTEKGAALLGEHDSPLIQMAASIAVGHHEKWDGTGYPRGLTGQSIPIEARIVAVADVFDALTSARPYKDPWSVEKVLGYLQENACVHFDPDVVSVVAARWDEMIATMESLRD